MSYGFPYKGSKNKLAKKIVNLFPYADNFYDLFCGGGAITHCALKTNKFENYYMNDINKMCTDLFVDAVNGRYKNETRWISREDFFKLKDTDPYVAFCWSFGNNVETYMYSKEIEPYKKALHYAIVFNDYSLGKELGVDLSVVDDIKGVTNRRLFLQQYLKNNNIWCNTPMKSHIKISEISQNLNRLQSLEVLQRLQSLTLLKTSNKFYDEIEIKPNSIIYCDIPYKDTDGYNNQEFDFDKFYNWCKNQTELLFISSYEMPDDFISVVEFEHRCTLSATANNKVIEKIFIPKHQKQLFDDKFMLNYGGLF